MSIDVVEEPQASSGGEDDDRLVSLFTWSLKTLDFLQENAETLFPREVVDDDAIQSMRTAWTEIRPLFDHPLNSSAWTSEERAALIAVGLTGSQLLFKFNVFQLLYSRFEASRPVMMRARVRRPGRKRRMFEGLFGREKKNKFWWDVFGWTRLLLKDINSILGSAAKAFPPLEIVKEFKESQEALFETRDRIVEELNES